MKLYTIGFTQKPARKFFSLLKDARVERLIDIRLNPGGQLAGFAKQDDLAFFLAEIVGCQYRHIIELAPTAPILSDYRDNHDWEQYVRRFEALMDERNVPDSLDLTLFADKKCCLLCSEATPEKCHRRLVAERLARQWPDVEVVHLV